PSVAINGTVPDRPVSPPAFVPKPTKAVQPKSVNKTRNLTPALTGTLNINVTKVSGGGAGPQQKSVPGSDFLSNEDIRAFCE
ncbi:hypothetical protein KBZ21_41710, partial [Streptomyces sp. A73]|nr:hypothetical protein [Streptomyces sp. A73]